MQHSVKQPTIGHIFNELATINSTNTHAMQQIQAKLAVHGTAYFAYEQTAGKGRQGKVWQTEPKANIILSVVIDAARLKINRQFDISIVAALAVYDLLNQYAAHKVCIKWPNDIYINDSKAAGILIENSLQGKKWQWSVIGIGVNINQLIFPKTLVNPVSLSLITKQTYNTVSLAKELCQFLENRYQQLVQGKTELLLKKYNEVLFKKDKVVNLKKNNISFNCTIQSVDLNGKLHVKDGLQDEFDFGEVEWVL